MIYPLALLILSLSVAARRLHDTGRSGWWQLLNLTGIGSSVLLMFFVLESRGDNQYGPQPTNMAPSQP